MTRLVLTILLGGLLLGSGCTREPGSNVLTKGSLRIACDEAVYPAVRAVAEEFLREYPESNIKIRSLQAREAAADFVNDSVRVIVLARPLNKEELAVLTGGNVWFDDFHVAQSAVAVVTDTSRGVKQMRVGLLDSLFQGGITHWPDGRVVDLAVGGLNSSTNEAFRDSVMGGKGFDRASTPFDSSGRLIEYVARRRNSIGIVNVNWLRGRESFVRVLALSRPGVFLDSSETVGYPYTPAQWYVYKGWYPACTPVMIYTREVERDISLGFIAFAAGAQGQKIFQNSGLVPATMPVRPVKLTSEQVR